MGKYLDRETKGILLYAPRNEETELIVEFIENWLAPRGCNLIVLLIRYAYQFESHPECAAGNGISYEMYEDGSCGWYPESVVPKPLSKENLIKIREACKRHGIKLVPKMNLLGHQSEKTHRNLPKSKDTPDGLLRAYPEFAETPDAEVTYARSLCPNHPGVKPIVFDLMDELVSICEADAIHIGCDEVHDIGLCDRCKGQSTADIFADWVNTLASHMRQSGKRVYMWGDRLLSQKIYNDTIWDAAGNGTEHAIDKVAKDIMICDWHYSYFEEYKSVGVFQDNGFDFLVCPWLNKKNAVQFLEYAQKHGNERLKGFMLTTWNGSAELARHLMGNKMSTNTTVIESAETIEELFSV